MADSAHCDFVSPILLDNASVQTLQPGFCFNTHMHHTAELSICLQGDLVYTIYNRNIRVSPGQIFLCYPDFPHSAFVPDCEATDFLQLHFRCLPVSDSEDYPIKEMALAFDVLMGQQQYLLEDCPPQLKSCVEGIVRELNSEDADLLIPAYLYQLNILLSREILKSSSASLIFKNKYLMKACTFINNHFMENITVSDVADAANISERYLSKLFHDCFHISVYSYITHIRISQSIDFMTRHPDYSLMQLAFDMGFSSQQHFTTVFKSIMTVSPKKYFSTHKFNQ